MVASLRRLFPRGLSTAGEVEKWTGLPYLGSIPRAETTASQLHPSAAVVEYDDPALAAAFRTMHATIFEKRPRAQVIALSSALPKDGKTTCSVALARVSALAGKRTVLVDCDLRRRSASAELSTPPAVGLLEVISGQASLDQALYLDGFTRLSFLPTSNNIELVRKAVVQDVFSDPRMAELAAVLRRRFDHIFFDTPPLLAVADTRLLASHVDSFLFVTRWKKTPRESVKMAVDLLKSTGAPLEGLMLTRAPLLAASNPRAAAASPVLLAARRRA